MATVPTPAQVLYQQEHIDDDRVANLIAANASCLALAFIFVGLRFMARRMKRIRYEADDWLCVGGLVMDFAPMRAHQAVVSSAYSG